MTFCLSCAQEDLCIDDAISFTEKGKQPYAVKWPRMFKKRVPRADHAQSLQDVFRWPLLAKENLERLKTELDPDVKPLLLSNKNLTISSNFSGICSQSRGSKILESHAIGSVSFQHVIDSVRFVLSCLRIIIYEHSYAEKPMIIYIYILY